MKHIYYSVKNYIKNLIWFHKEIVEFRPWDYSHNLSLFAKSLQRTCDYIETHGYEVEESRLQKVAKMKRAIQILDNIKNDSYLELAEIKLNQKYSYHRLDFVTAENNSYRLVDNAPDDIKDMNRTLSKLSVDIAKEEWDELWNIIKGSNDLDDGTNMQGWWD
jgi:hypothetical protein